MIEANYPLDRKPAFCIGSECVNNFLLNYQFRGEEIHSQKKYRILGMEDVPTIDINFDSVICGKKVHKSFTLENKSEKPQRYGIFLKKGSSPHDGRLQINPMRAVALPRKVLHVNVTYLSYLENLIDNLVYSIYDCEKLVAFLKIHAQSVGPSINFTVYNFKFFCFRNQSQTIKQVEISNKTKCEAKFCFDIDEDNTWVYISQTSGILPSGSKLNLRLTFKPTDTGTYYKRIFCIIQFHKPLVFNIIGLNRPKLRIEPSDINFEYPLQANFNNSYDAFMSKCVSKMLPEEGKISFSQKCVQEYETCLQSEEEVNNEQKKWSFVLDSPSVTESNKSVENNPQEVILITRFIDIKNLSVIKEATTLVNLSETKSFFYRWDHDPKKHFQINPCQGEILPNQKINFSLHFTPPSPDMLYHIDIDVKVFPCSSEIENTPVGVILPLTMTLRIIGHSFYDEGYGWIPQCVVVPKELQLPTCVPGEIVYGTVLIERQGHLPVTFVTISSKNTGYLIQPPLGYISGKFQLLVIQFDSKLKKQGKYKEELKILYNNTESNYDIIKLTTLVEIPNIIFGTDNQYSFEDTFPGSKTFAKVPVENTTNLYLSYEFTISEEIDWMEIPEPRGKIEPLSFGYVEVIFKPKIPCKYSDHIQCSVSSVSMSEYLKKINIQFQGFCEYGYLVATPSIYDFGECVYGIEKTTIIHLFNFSPVLLNFQLYPIYQEFSTGNVIQEVKITPCEGTVMGKGRLDVEVKIVPFSVDVNNYAIMCQILQNDVKDESFSENPKSVFTFTVKGVLPAIQILDINIDGGGPLFSPHWMWKMMSISRINKLLNSLIPEEQINLKLPEAMFKSCPITIALLLEANKYGDSYINIEKKAVCSCGKKAEKCTHENSVIITPTEVKLGPKNRLILQIILTYEDFKTFHIVLTFYLPYNRKIILNSTIVTLPDDESFLASTFLEPTFNLKPVYIGDPEPSLQLFWLYNNTFWPTFYVVHNLSLEEPRNLARKIIDCKNPNGTIPPFSCVPLMFLFKPNELIFYSAKVSLTINDNICTSIRLYGEGVPYVNQFEELKVEKTLPEKPILYNSTVCLECSLNVINITFFHTFSVVQRIFFIRNRSDSEIWAFQWHNFRAENLIYAHIEPVNGIIEPQEEISMTLILRSFSHPSFASFSVPCDVINYTKLKAYETALRYKEKLIEQSNDYFTITEKGMSYDIPEVTVPEKPESYHIFITVNANIISSLHVNQKLTLKQQLFLRTGEEVESKNVILSLQNSNILPPIQLILEKIIWNALNSKIFTYKIKTLQNFNDYSYLHILPENEQERKEILSPDTVEPSLNFIQSFLENMLRIILLNNFMPYDCKN